MPRVTTVKKAQKPARCEKCGQTIEVGQPYKWIKPRTHRGAVGHKRRRCASCPMWRPSETTSSTALSAVYGAQEAAADALRDWDREDADALRSILDELASGVREGADAYQESADNIESGFGHATSTSEELAEKADTLNSSADDVEGVDIEDFDEAEAIREALGDVTLWEVVNKDGSGVALEGETFDAPEAAQEALERLCAQSGDDPETLSVEEVDLSEFTEMDALPASVSDTVREAVEEAREQWASEQEDAVQEAIDNIEIP